MQCAVKCQSSPAGSGALFPLDPPPGVCSCSQLFFRTQFAGVLFHSCIFFSESLHSSMLFLKKKAENVRRCDHHLNTLQPEQPHHNNGQTETSDPHTAHILCEHIPTLLAPPLGWWSDSKSSCKEGGPITIPMAEKKLSINTGSKIHDNFLVLCAPVYEYFLFLNFLNYFRINIMSAYS